MKKSDPYNSMSPFEFKNILLDVADQYAKEHNHSVLNAGRGNPNFCNTTVRDAFSFLMHFMSLYSSTLIKHKHLGLRPPRNGIAKKLQEYLKKHHKGEGADFLDRAIHFAETHYHLIPDDFIFELGDAALGDFYPSPPRIFPNMEKIHNHYLHRILGMSKPFEWFDLFATEGATMAMVYIFNTLKENHLLKAHDHIAIVTPIFSPYLEIPPLKDYQLREVYVETDPNHHWQISDKELEKLKDPEIKALFLVNPSNPPGVSIDEKTREKLVALVKNDRPDLIIISDDVYATFVNDFVSLSYLLPENTIGVYSYSKYFGVTGWRLGLIMIHENNIFDRLIQALPERVERELDRRYRLDSADPRHIKFAERLMVDSRDVALAHTGGLSGPQQSFMTLLSLFELMDDDYEYKQTIHGILKHRVDLLHDHLGMELLSGPHYTHYYTLIDLIRLAESRHGKAFAEKFSSGVSVHDFLLKLAQDTATVCLPGSGFAGPSHTIRISLANLDDEAYAAVGANIAKVIDEYHVELSD
jgi:aspartate 4-decarboxylase